MTGNLRRRVAVVVLTAILSGTAAFALPSPSASAQELPPLPPVPQELDPVLDALSPTIWAACDGAGLTATLLLIVAIAGGVPAELTGPLGLDPILGLCSLVPLPNGAPDCPIDASVPPLGALGRPIAPGAVLVTQADALDALFNRVLGQAAGVLGPPITAGLGCTPKSSDDSRPPPEGALPSLGLPPASASTTLSGSLGSPGSANVGDPEPDVTTGISAGPPNIAAGNSRQASGWTAWRFVLVGLALMLAGFGLPRVSLPKDRFRIRR